VVNQGCVTIFEDTPALRQALAALPSEAKAGLKVRRHPWIGKPRMLVILARSLPAGRTVGELANRFATCAWGPKGWAIRRVQLKLFRDRAA
jgi:hypothetical protein